MDVEYTRTRGPLGYILLVLKTIPRVFSLDGIQGEGQSTMAEYLPTSGGDEMTKSD